MTVHFKFFGFFGFFGIMLNIPTISHKFMDKRKFVTISELSLRKFNQPTLGSEAKDEKLQICRRADAFLYATMLKWWENTVYKL